jgi:hypothetical protein
MPNVMSGDTKESVFVLKFGETNAKMHNIEIRPVRAKVIYTIVATSERKCVERELKINVKKDKGKVELDESVLINFYRVKAAEVLKEAAILGDAGQLAEARELLNKGIEELRTCLVSYTELVKMLINDMVRAVGRFNDQQAYEIGGRAEVKNMAMNHRSKRGENNLMYQNHCQQSMQIKSKAFFG